MTVGNYLSGLDYATPIYTYDTADHWVTKLASDNMTPGSGYAVYCNSAGTIVPGCN